MERDDSGENGQELRNEALSRRFGLAVPMAVRLAEALFSNLTGTLATMSHLSVQTSSEECGFDLVLRSMRQQWPMIARCILIFLVSALLYLFLAPSMYTASTVIMVDSRKSEFLHKDETLSETRQIDPGLVDSQVEILKSEGLALAVIKNLKLINIPDFIGKGPNLIGSLKSQISSWISSIGSNTGADDPLERQAVQKFTSNTTVKRLGVTYVIEVRYRAATPLLAATIANGIADAYMVGELEAKYQSNRRANQWRQGRLIELRDQATRAEQAVQAFKAQNNIINLTQGLMTERQLTDVSGQLITARAESAEIKARLDRILEISNSEIASVADALQNNVITKLRTQYLDLSAKEALWSARYGINHVANIHLRKQMTEAKRSIMDEVRRIAETYKSDYQIVQARERSLQESLAKLVGEAGTVSEAVVKLRDLQSAAQTFRALYDSFLQKFEESTQHQTFPTTDARVVTVASAPLNRSSPKTLIVLGEGIVLGLVVGGGVAVWRELLNNKFRIPEDVESLAKLKCLGILPKVPARATDRFEKPSAENRRISVSGLMRQGLNSPFSRYSEVLRNVKVSIDFARQSHKIRTIGIVSSVPREGKTVVAANIAQLVARTGNSTLLIDVDLHSPSLTREIAPHARAGLMEVLSGQLNLADVIYRDVTSGCNFLPTITTSCLSDSAELLSSGAMERLLADAEETHDYVFVDLAPLALVVDAKAMGHLIDCFILVIEWNQTTGNVVREALSAAGVVHERTLGAILNKADPALLKRFEGYKGRYHSY